MAKWRYIWKYMIVAIIFSSICLNGFLLFRNFAGPMNFVLNQKQVPDAERKGKSRIQEGRSIHMDRTKTSNRLAIDRQVLRKKALLQACTDLEFEEHPSRDHNLTVGEIKSLKHSYAFDKHELIFCYIPKVGCTSWKHLFLVSYGVFGQHSKRRKRAKLARSVHTVFDSVFKKLSQLDLEDANEKLKDFQQFLFVRNPFSRLLSAYREKIEDRDPADPIKGHYSQFLTRWFKKSDPGFVQQRNISTPYSFRDFVRYFMSRRIEDEHWNDQYQLCHPCLVEYDFIGKYETLHEDAQELLGSVVNGSSLTFPTADPSKRSRHSSSDENLANYYRTIPDEDFLLLINCLYPDLRLFGYSIPESVRRPNMQLPKKHVQLVDAG